MHSSQKVLEKWSKQQHQHRQRHCDCLSFSHPSAIARSIVAPFFSLYLDAVLSSVFTSCVLCMLAQYKWWCATNDSNVPSPVTLCFMTKHSCTRHKRINCGTINIELLWRLVHFIYGLFLFDVLFVRGWFEGWLRFALFNKWQASDDVWPFYFLWLLLFLSISLSTYFASGDAIFL